MHIPGGLLCNMSIISTLSLAIIVTKVNIAATITLQSCKTLSKYYILFAEFRCFFLFFYSTSWIVFHCLTGTLNMPSHVSVLWVILVLNAGRKKIY